MHKNMKIKDMDSKVYQLRRQVMGYIYEAKELYPNLPRINVRITEDDETCLAYAYLNKNIIRISTQAIIGKGFDLRTIVFHELVHAVFGFRHDDACELMRPKHRPLSKAKADKLFKKYVKMLGKPVRQEAA